MIYYFIFIIFLNLYFLDKSINFYVQNMKNRLIDMPNFRSMHQTPIPTGSGILILLSCTLSYTCLFLFNPLLKTTYYPFLKIILISTPLCIIGFCDDWKDINQRLRFTIQILTGIFLLINSNLLDSIFLYNNFVGYLVFFSLLLVIAGLINSINFMDGIDGLVLGTFAIIFSALTIKFNFNLILISSILILFLKWNWNPAKVFIGDAGSTFLGAIYAGVILSANNYLDSLSIFMMSMPLIIDSFFCLVWRLLNGFNVFEAHNMHLYQRLVKSGFSHKQVSSIYILAVGFISLFYLIGNIFFEFVAVILSLCVGIYLSKFINSKNNHEKIFNTK